MSGSDSRDRERGPGRAGGRGRDVAGWTRWYDGGELARTGAHFGAKLPVMLFERVGEALGGALADHESEVDARLAFGAEGRLIAVRGSLSSRLRLVCQRCLQAYEVPLASEFSILAAESEGMLEWAEQKEEEREAVLLEGRVRPLDFIEEELLLALPLVPRHPDPADCVDLSPWAKADTA